MIVYQIISIADVICKYRKETVDVKKEVSKLGSNILALDCQWVFSPINVVRYKKGGLRSKKPPFEYRVSDVESAKKYWVHMALGLEVIRAKVDTTFREDGINKKNPFPKRWTPNLGISNTAQHKAAVKLFRKDKRQAAWIDMLVKKGRIKFRVAKVAVILTSYNRPTLVQKAINSILVQTFKDWHLYLIDNNSNAPTKNVLRRYKNRYPNKITLHFLKTPNSKRLEKGWLSYMINWAIRKGKEPLITLLTDDCWFAPNKLLWMAKFMNSHPAVQICYGTQIIVDTRGRELRRRPANRAIPPHKGAGVLDHNQVMFRRTLIRKVGFWNESKHVMGAPDADFWTRIPYPKYPVKRITDYYLEHNKRFQHYYYGRRGVRKELKKEMVME